MCERIIPEQVVEAYKTTGLKPIQRDMYENGTCACAIGALLYDKTGGWTTKAWNLAKETFDDSYLWGFIRGYDGMPEGRNRDRDEEMVGESFNGDVYDTGYLDGQAAWQAVIDAGLTGVSSVD